MNKIKFSIHKIKGFKHFDFHNPTRPFYPVDFFYPIIRGIGTVLVGSTRLSPRTFPGYFFRIRFSQSIRRLVSAAFRSRITLPISRNYSFYTRTTTHPTLRTLLIFGNTKIRTNFSNSLFLLLNLAHCKRKLPEKIIFCCYTIYLLITPHKPVLIHLPSGPCSGANVVTCHFGWERQIGFFRPEGKISLREGSSHELSHCAWVRLALIRRGLGHVGWSWRKNIYILRVASSLHILLCASAGPLLFTDLKSSGEGRKA